MDKYLILSSPLVKRIWGGNYFKDTLNYTDSNEKFGEMWTTSALDEAPSIILNGKYKDLTLKETFNKAPELFNFKNNKDFPILVKIIATSDKLSVQIHPDDEYAYKYENQPGKTEGWLILDAKENSSIVIGHNAKNKEELVNYINNNDYAHLLNKRVVTKGEFYPIPSKTIHAIGKDIVLLEVQQSSNLTYRFYDYDRVDKNGNKRELHLKKAIDVTSYKPYDQKIVNCFKDNISTIWDNQYFKVDLINIEKEKVIKNDKDFLIVSVIEGTFLLDDHEITFGKSFIITYGNEVILKGNGKVVTTSYKYGD